MENTLQHYPLSIVIPVYNEYDNVQPLADEIIQSVDFTSYEIIFVDDGSQDHTPENLQSLTKEHPQIRIISHATNFGQSASIITGIKAAKYDFIITMDGDGQNDPRDISKLLTTLVNSTIIDKDQVAVIGIRAVRHDTWLRRVSSRFANFIRRKMLNDNCLDSSCGLKLFSRQAFSKLPLFNHMHRFLPVLFQSIGVSVLQVPVNHRPRTKGQSKYGIHNRLWIGISDLFGVMWIVRRTYQARVKNELS